MHWAIDLIGTRWRFGGQNPDTGFDCWGLFRYVQKTHYGLDLPNIEVSEQSMKDSITAVRAFEANQERENWFEVTTPKDGDGVLLRIARYPHHVGVWIDTGTEKGVLHAIEAGVMFNTPNRLKANGWKIAKYYRHKTNAKTSEHSS